MLRSADVMAFVCTTDPARARHFYGEVLGLAMKADEEFALVFEANGTMLRVQKVKEVPPPRATVLGWKVEDIEAAAQRLTRKGVEFMRVDGLPQDEIGIWTAPDGTKVAWFKDPDGNILSLTEF